MCRNIHCHYEGAVARSVFPAMSVAARLLEYPFPDLNDVIGLLGERDQNGRCNRSLLGVVPSEKRLDADHAAILNADMGWYSSRSSARDIA